MLKWYLMNQSCPRVIFGSLKPTILISNLATLYYPRVSEDSTWVISNKGFIVYIHIFIFSYPKYLAAISYPIYVLYLLSRISKMCGKCHRMRILIIRIEFSSNFLWQSIKLDVYEEKTDIISAKYALKLNFLHWIYWIGWGPTAYMLTPTSTIKLWINIWRGLICKGRVQKKKLMD